MRDLWGKFNNEIYTLMNFLFWYSGEYFKRDSLEKFNNNENTVKFTLDNDTYQFKILRN